MMTAQSLPRFQTRATPDVEMVFVNNGSHLLVLLGGQYVYMMRQSLVTTRVFRQTGAQAVAAAPGGKASVLVSEKDMSSCGNQY
jgi:hypothetical protein